MQLTNIYLLTDQRYEYFYIGKADDPAKRLREHLVLSKDQTKESYYYPKHLWMRYLEACLETPILSILEIVPEDQWGERERHWIAHYRGEFGPDRVLNLTDGGDGGGGGKAEDHWNAKIDRGIVRQLRSRCNETNWSAISREFGLKISHVRAILRNETWYDPDYVPPGHRGVNVGNATLNWEIVEEIRSSDLLGTELAERFGVSKSTISEIRNYKTWIKADDVTST